MLSGCRVYVVSSLLSVVAVASASADPRGDAQKVADLEARIASTTKRGGTTASLEAKRNDAVDRWLRSELAALGSDAGDAAIVQTRAILGVARERARAAVEQEARAHGDALVERRAGELDAMIERRRWYQALAQLEAWVPGPDAPGQATKKRIQARIATAVDAARRASTTDAERFLFGRMHGWLGESVAADADAAALQVLATQHVTLARTSAGCGVATAVRIPDAATGTPVTIRLTLGTCDVAVRAQSGIPRSETYTVEIPRTREETYTDYVEKESIVQGTEQVCGQVDKDISGGSGPKNMVRVTECHDGPGQYRVQTEKVPVERTRTVSYTDTEQRTESFLADTTDSSTSLTVSVTVDGDGQSVTIEDHASAEEHDERYTRAHGDSRAFRPNIREILEGRLDAAVQAQVVRAVAAWRTRRAQALLAAGAEAADPHVRRARGVEAIAVDPAQVDHAAPLVDVELAGEPLVALITSEPVVTPLMIGAGRGLALPPASPSLLAELARLEVRHDELASEGNRDGLAAMGIGLHDQPMQDAVVSFALEIQAGYVPAFNASSIALFRVEGDLQILSGHDSFLDSALRPEAGLRLGPLDVGAVGVIGARVAWTGASIDKSELGDLSSAGYVGYGGHAALHPSKILLDALMLRQYQWSPKTMATRADGIVGYRIKESFYATLRLRYIEGVEGNARSASATIGLMSQY